MSDVVKPSIPRIGRNDETEKLYVLEEQRSEAVKRSARELAVILGHTPEQFWTHTMPEALASVLDTYERKVSEAAAIAYLEHFGYIITKKE